jgi:hypothetical protein
MPKFQYKQTYTNSCGAVCLMCSAKELGVDAFPEAQPWIAAPLVMSKWTETNVSLYTGTPEKKSTGFFSAKVNMPATRACHQLAGFGRWAPPGPRIGAVSPDCHTQPSIGAG